MQTSLRRWAIEDSIRDIKSSYGLENVRVLTCKSLQNLIPVVMVVMFLCACVLDHDGRLRVMASYVEKAAKRIFGVPEFKFYALAYGLSALLMRFPSRPMPRIRPPTESHLDLQLEVPA